MASITLRRAGRQPLAQRIPALCRASSSQSAILSLFQETPANQIEKPTGIKSPLYESQSLKLQGQQRTNAYFNKGLELRVQRDNIVGAIKFWNTSIAEGTRPDRDSYLVLMKVFAECRLFDLCVRAFEDMIKIGVGRNQPDLKREALNLVMLSASENLSHIAKVYDLFTAQSIKPDATTYLHHLFFLDKTDNLERAIELINEMDGKQVPFSKECIRIVILMASRLNMPTLAMDLCVNAAKTLGRLDDEIYMGVLISAASTFNWKATTWAYDALTLANPSITLTEPLCINILNLAARQGHPTLAQSIIDYLIRERITIQEHHLTPLIGAYCNSPRNDGLHEAFLVLDKFKEHDLEILPENESTSELVKVLGKGPEAIDRAYDILLELPRPVNVEAVNAVLQAAAVTLSDLPRAIGVYKDLPNLQCEPTTRTFDILLAGCLKAQHKDLGEKLFTELLSKGLTPSSQTYTRLILLALTQTEYESAFIRLEEMKEKHMTPPLAVYEALVRRLVKENDPRADLALEDMESCGYRVGPQLRKFLLGEEKENEGKRDLLGSKLGPQPGRTRSGTGRRDSRGAARKSPKLAQ